MTRFFFSCLALLASTTFFATISAQATHHWTGSRPDGHAPIGVMGDHYHTKGGFMLSFRHMRMDMEGMIRESYSLPTGEVLQDYMISPSEMEMSMSMIGAMYAPTDRLTLMAMVNVLSNDMQLVTRMGGQFSTASGGLGDLSLGAVYKLMNANRHSVHLNAGVSIPTGDIDQRDATPMAESAPLAYPMQLGTGTWDPYLGGTYLGQTNRFSWGAQAMYRFRLGTNDRNFSYGNLLDMTGWVAIRATDWVSISGRLRYQSVDALDGSAPDWNANLMPLFHVDNSGRSQLDAGFGVNFYVPNGSLKKLRLGLEYVLPVEQHVNGIQMEIGNSLLAGIQYAF